MKYLTIILVFLVFIIVVLKISSTKQAEVISPSVFSDKNLIISYGTNPVLDTVLMIGLDLQGISGIKVVIKPMDDLHIEYEESSRAFITHWEGVFYLYVNDLYYDEVFKVLSHEIVHISQYLNKRLYVTNYSILWQDRTYPHGIPYDSRPWEIEAFREQGELSHKIQKVYYSH